MANRDFPGGFEPKRVRGGGTVLPTYYDIASNNSAIDKFDLVERGSDGYISRAQASSTTIVGVALEGKVANSGGKIAICDAPDVIYEAQADDSTIDAQTDFDLNYNIVAGSAAGGRSVMEIDASTQAATATLPIKILRVADDQTQQGNALGANVRLECMINQGILHAGNLG